jgi:hypothetical protein
MIPPYSYYLVSSRKKEEEIQVLESNPKFSLQPDRAPLPEYDIEKRIICATEKQISRLMHPCPKSLIKLFLRLNFTKDAYPGSPWIACPEIVEKFKLPTALEPAVQAAKDKYDKNKKRATLASGGNEAMDIVERELVKLKETPIEKEKYTRPDYEYRKV